MGVTAPLASPRLAAPARLKRLWSDAALAQRFCWGDEAAFAALYERHRASVLAVCMGVLGSRPDAEDAAQESFASLAVALRRSPPQELKPWLLRVARNAAVDLARRRRSTTSTDDAFVDQAASGDRGSTELDAVLAGLRQLPETQRIALLMRELAGHSYVEIAALLGIDEDGVRGLIARARVGLRAHRDAVDMPCSTAREALAAEPDGRRRDKTVRRHLKACPGCQAYGHGLRDAADQSAPTRDRSGGDRQ
jgi:RNA polymerase sigma factor (sigma-70 family)